MRHLAIIALVSFFSSCTSNNNTADEATDSTRKRQSEQPAPTIDRTDSLLGEWVIYATVSNGMETLSNVCPRITFDTDKTAILELPSGDKSKLRWRADGSILTIQYTDQKDDGEFFPDSIYTMEFQEEKGHLELNLKAVEEDYSLTLR